MSRHRCLNIFMRTENRTLLRVKLTLYEEPQVTTVCVRNEFVEIGSGKVSKQRATAHIHCSERRCEATHEASRAFSRSEPELRSVDERVRVRVGRRPSKIRFGAVSMDSDCLNHIRSGTQYLWAETCSVFRPSGTERRIELKPRRNPSFEVPPCSQRVHDQGNFRTRSGRMEMSRNRKHRFFLFKIGKEIGSEEK